MLDQVFEHERSQSRKISIPYDKTSLNVPAGKMDALVDHVYEFCGVRHLITARQHAKRTSAERRLKANLQSVLWHFYLAQQVGRDCFVSISLRECYYRKNNQENPHNITRDLSKVILCLEREGCVERRKGFYGGSKATSYKTSIRATLFLQAMLNDLPSDLSEEIITVTPVLIKGNAKGSAWQNCERIIKARETVGAFNEAVQEHDIVLPDAENGYLAFLDKNNGWRAVSTTKTTMRAIFHEQDDGEFRYGRIHGGMWQHIPSEFRSRLQIDGEETVELDYSAQSLNIVASLEGIQLLGDPYAIDLDMSDWSSDLCRDFVKKSVLTIFNAESKKAAFASLRGIFNKDERVKYVKDRLTNDLLNEIFDRIFSAHPFLKSWAFLGQGHKLFSIDAEIAREIIQEFIDTNEVILPIHDGFVVAARNRDLLENTMLSVWRKKFGTTIRISEE